MVDVEGDMDMFQDLLGSGGGTIVVLEATAMLVWNELRAVQEMTMLFDMTCRLANFR